MEEIIPNFVQVSSISKHLICPLCLEVFSNPKRVKCQHTFCYKCIYEWAKSNDTCPECRQEVRKQGQMKTDVLAQKLIDDLQVFCVNKTLCQWKGKLKDLKNHVSQCSVKNDCLPDWLKDKEIHNNNILSKNFSQQKLQLNEFLQERLNEEVNNQSLMSRVFQKSHNNQNLVSSMFQTQEKNNQFSEYTNFFNDQYDHQQLDTISEEKIRKIVEQKFLQQLNEQNIQNQKSKNSSSYDQLKSLLQIDDEFTQQSRRSLKTIKESQQDHEESVDNSNIQNQIQNYSEKQYFSNNIEQFQQIDRNQQQFDNSSEFSNSQQQSTQISQVQMNDFQLDGFGLSPEEYAFNMQYFKQNSQLQINVAQDNQNLQFLNNLIQIVIYLQHVHKQLIKNQQKYCIY